MKQLTKFCSISCAIAAATAALTMAPARADAIGSIKPGDAVDLTGFFWNGPLKAVRPVAFAPFDDGIAAGILAKSEEPSTPALSWEGVDEKKELARQKNAVSRKWKVLAVSMPDGRVVRFGNWKKPESPNAEGDGAKYVYAGTFGKYGYHRVIAHLEHDSPSTYFVNPQSGKAMFVHPTDFPFVASPNADQVFVADENGRSNSIAVGNLTQSGPFLDLGCVFESSGKARLTTSFRGWTKDSLGFDIVVSVPRQDGGKEAFPLRFSKSSDGWHGYATDPAAMNKQVRVQCSQQ